MRLSKFNLFNFILIIMVLSVISIINVSADTTFFDTPDDFFIIGSSIAGGTGNGIVGGATSQVAGGGSCRYEWNCTDWSECFSSKKQIRNCINLGNCLDTYKPPETERSCSYVFYGEMILREITNKNAIVIYFIVVFAILSVVFYLKRDYFRKLFKSF